VRSENQQECHRPRPKRYPAQYRPGEGCRIGRSGEHALTAPAAPAASVADAAFAEVEVRPSRVSSSLVWAAPPPGRSGGQPTEQTTVWRAQQLPGPRQSDTIDEEDQRRHLKHGANVALIGDQPPRIGKLEAVEDQTHGRPVT